MAGWYEDIFNQAGNNATPELKGVWKDVFNEAANQLEEKKHEMEITKKQTELARQQKAEGDVQKRRIQEKQIRSLRRNYRGRGLGMLGVGQPAAEDMNNTLGG